MPTFGYTAGDGTGSNILVVQSTFQAFTAYTNTTGATIYVDTLILKGVSAVFAGSVALAIYDYHGHPYPLNLLAKTATLSALSVGDNTFTISGDPLAVAPGVTVFACIGASTDVRCNNATATQRAVRSTGGGVAFPATVKTFPGLINQIIPVVFSGSSTGPGDPTNAREDLLSVEAETSGYPQMRVDLYGVDALIEGYPVARLDHSVVQALFPVIEGGPMATDLFPALAGLSWSVIKTPNFSTQVRPSTNLREARNSMAPFPVWDFELSYDYLSNDRSEPNAALGDTDLRYLIGFFLKQNGSAYSWLFKDPKDYRVDQEPMIRLDDFQRGGTGTQTTFYFNRPMGPADEPVGQVSFAEQFTFLPAAVNTATDAITATAHGLTIAGGPYFVGSTTTLPAGLSADTPYWPIVVDANTFKLAATEALAVAGTAVNITSQGAGVHSLTKGFAVFLNGDEATSVPGSGPFTVTVARTPFVTDGGVILNSSGAALVYTAGAPAAGQYTHDGAGQYTFNAAQAGASITINYRSQVAAADGALLAPNRYVFDTAPAAGLTPEAQFEFYFVCRFKEDHVDFEEFVSDLWEAKEVSFRSVIQ